MKIHILLILSINVCALSTHAQLGELLQVRPGGVIVPTNFVATLADVAAAAASASAAATEAAIVKSTSLAVSNNITEMREIINSLEGVGYIRAYMLDFGVSGTEANTNVTANIIDFTPAVSNDATWAYSDIYTFFTEAPDGFPVCVWQETQGRTNEWNVAESVNVILTERIVGDTLYECYRNTVRVPVGSASAFFCIFAEAVQAQVGAFLPVRNGISPAGREPLTATFVAGTNVISYVGGIRVRTD